ncbi:hypothetical protein ACFRSX_35410 [Streptomyces goshikiensis]|uniref:effector-associated constant component EACC1 n=1 Tax=Streptomyces TaxID=1883 RepID=UPI00093E1F9F|nr:MULTISPECIES: hypothetical protein [unclassified Streptomyces]OKI26560.1 hypothetical protein A6A28_16365 [Streptomyces sp. CB03578]PJN13930.1 hypothetical protein CG724_36995 [Streptomyces sp. CB02120-2]
MDVRVLADGQDAADQLRSLQEWLVGVEELRGRVTAEEAPPPPGKLGPVLETLVVALGPGGAVTAFSVAVLAWLRTRRGDVRIKLTLLGGRSLELTARRVSGLDAEALRRQVADMTDALAKGGAEGEVEAIAEIAEIAEGGNGGETGGTGRRELR